MDQFGSTNDEILRNTLGISAEDICERVVISPGWMPERIFDKEEIELLVESSPLSGFKLWTIAHERIKLTYIRTGFGASMMTDAILLLGLTPCRQILFISSVGALSEEIGIGDLLIPEYSACGDGASRYLSEDIREDTFAEKQYPNKVLFEHLCASADRVCEMSGVKWHLGKTFCTDTIVGQYRHLGQIIDQGYNSVDMESAAAFKAAKLSGLQIAALLNVSDNSVADKSLMVTRTEKEKRYRKFVRKKIIPQIVHVFLTNS